MESKTVRDVLALFYVDNSMNWGEYRDSRCTAEESNKHEKYLEENTEQEIRAIVRAEVMEELRGVQRNSMDRYNPLIPRVRNEIIVLWQDIEALRANHS